MQKFLPLTLFALLLTACGGSGGSSPPASINVTGEWTGGLETTSGGGLGGFTATLVQAPAPATTFTGTMSSPLSGANAPVIGDVSLGTLNIDTSVAGVNQTLAFTCQGTFTSTSYRGNCTMPSATGAFVLVLGRK